MGRFVLKFNKGEEVRWLGHLDLLRAFERVIRRADLPVAYSQGFNPRAKMSFLSALGVGVTGGEEVLSIDMAEDLEPTELVERMNQQMPGGLTVLEARKLAEGEPKTPRITGSEFMVTLKHEDEDAADENILREAVEKLLSQEEITTQRSKSNQTKTVNLRPGIESIAVVDSSQITLRLIHGERFTVKPSEVVEELSKFVSGLKIERVHRIRMY
jgi:radical SAM-linked protein